MKDLHRVTKEDILALLRQTSTGGVLSLYVGIPASDRHESGRLLSGVRSGLTDLLHKYAGNRVVAGLAEKAQEEIGKFAPETRRRSLVYFRSLDPDWVFWRSLHPVVPDLIAYAPSPQVAHLVSLLDESPRIGLAVVAQDRTRVFSWKDGIIEEHPAISAEEETTAPPEAPGHAMPPNRLEDRTRRGLREMAGRIARTGDGQHWHRLLLVGPGIIVSAIAEQLPDVWRRLTIQPAERNMINAPLAEICDLAGKKVCEWRRHEELTEITELVNEARSGGRAAISVSHCLDYLHQGRVEKLYVCSDLELSGFSSRSGHLYAHPPADPGESPVRQEPRLVEKMIVQAFEAGAAVIPVEGESAHKLTLLGGVAARLRWKDQSVADISAMM